MYYNLLLNSFIESCRSFNCRDVAVNLELPYKNCTYVIYSSLIVGRLYLLVRF